MGSVLIVRYCIDCRSVGEGDLTVLGLGGSREKQVYVGVCSACYSSEWHQAIYGGEDGDKEFVDELVNEALDMLEEKWR